MTPWLCISLCLSFPSARGSGYHGGCVLAARFSSSLCSRGGCSAWADLQTPAHSPVSLFCSAAPMLLFLLLHVSVCSFPHSQTQQEDAVSQHPWLFCPSYCSVALLAMKCFLPCKARHVCCNSVNLLHHRKLFLRSSGLICCENLLPGPPTPPEYSCHQSRQRFITATLMAVSGSLSPVLEHTVSCPNAAPREGFCTRSSCEKPQPISPGSAKCNIHKEEH